MAKALRVGFIGAGGIAGQHAKFLSVMDGVEIAAASDTSTPALEAFREKWEVSAGYTDYRAMIATEDLDAVSVCTPNFLHSGPTIDALKQGLHVLVEKPMAMGSSECTQMIAAARKAGRQLVVGYQWRFSPTAQFMRQQVADGVVGDVLYVRVQALRRRGIPSWGVFGRKDLQGGGPLIDIGVHIIEMAHYIIGKPAPLSASASTYTYLGDSKPRAKAPWGDWDYRTYTVEDLAVGFVRFEGGATMNVEASFAAHIEQDVFNIQIMGTKGGLTFDPPKLFHDHHGYMLTSAPEFLGKDEMWKAKMAHFVRTCRTGRGNQAPGEDGLAVQQILDGLYASADAGGEVAVNAPRKATTRARR